MKTAIAFLMIGIALVGMSAVHAQQLTAVAAKPQIQPVQMATVNFVGNLHGMQAVASVSFERLYSYVLMAGQIRSRQATYMFRVDLVGASGFGEAISLGDGQRIPIRVDLMPAGFALTSNPFGPGMPTTYHFKRN